MKKPKRNRRARNKIEGSSHGALVQADPFIEAVIDARRSTGLRVARQSLFNAELEEVIEIIARERVYQAMLGRLGRLLSPPVNNGDVFDA